MNWPLEQFKDKSVVFVGEGQGRSMSGFETFIRKHGEITDFEGVDKDTSGEPLAFLQNYDQDQTVFMKNEGIPGDEMPVPYLTPINVFFSCVRKLQTKTVGITGTKGKSTTAALTSAMLRSGGLDSRLVGNIGDSVFNEIETATPETIFTVELSSYQLSDIEYSPDIAVCTNLFNDHSDWHGSRELYEEAKHKIIAKSRREDLFIYNPEFKTLANWAKNANCRTAAIDKDEFIDLSTSRLFGEHNRLNALAARLVATELGISDADCQTALNQFEPLPHRMQYVAEVDGRIFIDDAIGMTPESTIASMQAIKDKYGPIGCLLLGGQDRNYNFTELFKLIGQDQIPNLVLFPDTVDKMKAAMPVNYKPMIFEANDMDDAVAWAQSHAPKDSVVLLSTAAPSYSLWKNGFEEKGRLFQENVRKYIN